MIHGENELTDALTYGEWQERGYQVIKGQMSKLRSPTGGALFTKEQVSLKEFSGDYYEKAVEEFTSTLS